MAKFKVTAPNAGYSGTVGGVKFTDGVAEIDESTHAAELSYCRAAGYHVEEAGAGADSDGSGEAGASTPNDGRFDPAKHSVEDVLGHLNGADEAEAIRVLDAEAEGKNRKGITAQRDAILSSRKGE